MLRTVITDILVHLSGSIPEVGDLSSEGNDYVLCLLIGFIKISFYSVDTLLKRDTAAAEFDFPDVKGYVGNLVDQYFNGPSDPQAHGALLKRLVDDNLDSSDMLQKRQSGLKWVAPIKHAIAPITPVNKYQGFIDSLKAKILAIVAAKQSKRETGDVVLLATSLL